ncbi:MAG: ADP/ATP carrier protein [Bacteroidetes bacterium]|nr:ADP/ATP carrier protein [Bacteroidota bacterium]
MEERKEKEFGFLRNIFFPIYKYELNKFVPLALLFLCICYNYSILRSSKDIFVLKNSDTTAIYYLKSFGVTPVIFIVTFIYSFISTRMGRDGRFNSIIIYFLCFFFIYLVFILPNVEKLKLTNFGAIMNSKFPRFKGLWAIITNWHTSLFYIHSDMWGTYAMQILFWTFANEIVNFKQAKRFFGLLIVLANVGAFIAGASLKFFLKGNPNLILLSIFSVGILALIVYNYLSKKISINPNDYQIEENKKPKKKKIKLGFKDSLKYIAKSKYLMLIASLVLCYNVSIALFESVQKDRLKAYCAGNEELFADIYGNQLIGVAFITIVLLFFLSPWIRKKSWSIMAAITPIVFGFGVMLFFSFIFFGDFIKDMFQQISSINLDTLKWSMIIGTSNVVFIKGAKYAFFDQSKEMSYAPLDEQSRVVGKAAVDGIGSRLGKSLGSILVTFIFIQLPGTGGTIFGAKGYIAVSILIVLVIWLISVFNLGIRFKKLTQNENESNN